MSRQGMLMTIAEMPERSGSLDYRAPALHRRASHEHELTPPNLFASFWLGGFESACQINTRHCRLDMLAVTQHDQRAAEDYAMLRQFNIRAARDGVRWPLIERTPGRYDFSSFLPMLEAAKNAQIQVIWNLCHYGWPDDLDLFSPAFADRFAKFCRALARFVRGHSDAVPFYTPINEISFLAWAIGTRGIIQPIAFGRGWEAKCQLVRAAIAGMEAIWDVDPRARFAHVDPILNVVPPRDRPDLLEAARIQNEAQFHAWDMLCGRLAPELGGQMKYLDIVGVNYYHANQFEHPDVRLRWEDTPRDDRFVPFHQLLEGMHRRYQRPLFVAETSHFGEGRARWLHEIAEEVCTARLRGTPLQGVCLYPILDRPDWEDPNHWHNSGLIDLFREPDGALRRMPNLEYLAALRDAQRLMHRYGCC